MPAVAHNLLTRREAAEALGISMSKLRRDEDAGAPVAQPGARGRGKVTLYDLTALRAWYEGTPAAAPAPAASDGLRELLVELPDTLAGIAEEVFKAVDGKHKIALADALSGLSVRLICALRDKFGGALELPPLTALPEFLTYLRELAKLLEPQNKLLKPPSN